VCSENPLNPNVWSFRKVAKTASKLGHRGGKIEKKLKPSRSRSIAKHVAKQVNNNLNNNGNPGQNRDKANQNFNRVRQDMQRVVTEISKFIPKNPRYRVRARGLEDDEELLRRDLDDEEVFGREYGLLDERDTFDDLD
jgi:hypothetical protein